MIAPRRPSFSVLAARRICTFVWSMHQNHSPMTKTPVNTACQGMSPPRRNPLSNSGSIRLIFSIIEPSPPTASCESARYATSAPPARMTTPITMSVYATEASPPQTVTNTQVPRMTLTNTHMFTPVTWERVFERIAVPAGTVRKMERMATTLKIRCVPSPKRRRSSCGIV